MPDARKCADRAEQQRRRRMRRRSCRCGRQAEFVLDWQGQSVPVCPSCQRKLEGAEPFAYFCAFDEVPASLLRPSSTCPTGPEGIVEEADREEGAASLLAGRRGGAFFEAPEAGLQATEMTLGFVAQALGGPNSTCTNWEPIPKTGHAGGISWTFRFSCGG